MAQAKTKTKAKAKTKNKQPVEVDYSKFIGVGIILIGAIIIALLIVLLTKTFMDEKKYTISYHSNDKLAEQVVEQSELDGDIIAEENISYSPEKYIAVDKALDIALENIGVGREAVWDIEVELDYKFGQVVYEVSFNYDRYEYEYYINAESGAIIKSFKEIE